MSTKKQLVKPAPRGGPCFQFISNDLQTAFFLHLLVFGFNVAAAVIAAGDSLSWQFLEGAGTGLPSSCSLGDNELTGKKAPVLFLDLSKMFLSNELTAACLLNDIASVADRFTDTGREPILDTLLYLSIIGAGLSFFLCWFGAADMQNKLEYDNSKGRITVVSMNILVGLLGMAGGSIVTAGRSQTCYQLPEGDCFISACGEPQRYCCDVNADCRPTEDTLYESMSFANAHSSAVVLEAMLWGVFTGSTMIIALHLSRYLHEPLADDIV